MLYQNTSGKDASDNWISTLGNVDTDFLSFFCDDDLIFYTGDNHIDYSDVDRSIVAMRPSIVHWAKESGIYNSSNFSITNSSAKERIESYLNLNNSHNTTLYSAYRSDIIIPLYLLQNKYHPTRSGYADWSIVFGLISSGLINNDPNSILVYKNTNWYGTSDFINDNIVKLFTEVDLPPKSAHLLPLFKALDTFILIMRSFSPVEFNQKIAAATYILLFLINSFLSSERSIINLFTQTEINLFAELSKVQTLRNALDLTLSILSLQRDDLHGKYLTFYFHSTGHEFDRLV